MPIKSSKRAVGKVKAVKAWAIVCPDNYIVPPWTHWDEEGAEAKASDLGKSMSGRYVVIPVLISPLPKPSRKATTKTAKRGAKKHG